MKIHLSHPCNCLGGLGMCVSLGKKILQSLASAVLSMSRNQNWFILRQNKDKIS